MYLLQRLQVNGHWDPGVHVGLIYRDRMRTIADKKHVIDTFSSIFGTDVEVYCCKVK